MNITPDPIPLEDALPSCAICSVSSLTIKIRRLNLIVQSVTADGRHTTRGAGGIYLCERCWRAASKDALRFSGRRARIYRKSAA